MCDLTAYLLEKQEMEKDDCQPIMQSVTSVVPDGEGIILTDIFGETKFIEARIDSLMDNKVYLINK